MNKLSLITAVLVSTAVYLPAHAKIYDCFLFFNELELLEMRLNELYDHVDKFVLVESKETFRGASKPLYYQENKHLFKKFADKIIHVIVDGHYEAKSAWDREGFQRNQIMAGLKNCMPDDIILISDVDEIVRGSIIREITTKLIAMPKNDTFKFVSCQQILYRYFLNRFDPKESPWYGTIGIFYSDLKKYSPEYYRNNRGKTPYVIPNAGWHFSYMGGHQRVVTKLAAFSHAECDTEASRNIQNLEIKIKTFPLVPIDGSYPKIIQDRYHDYIKMGFIDTTNSEKIDLSNIILCTGPALHKKQQMIETTEHDLQVIPFKSIIIATADTKNLGLTFDGIQPCYLLFKERGKQLDCLNCIILCLRAVANNPEYANNDIILFKHESVYINDINLVKKAIRKINDGYDIVCKYWIGFEDQKTKDRLNDWYHTDSFFMKVSAARKLLPFLNEITHFTPDFQFCEEFFTKYIVNQLPRVYKIDYHHSNWKDNELGFYHIPRYEYDPNWDWNKSNYDTLYL